MQSVLIKCPVCSNAQGNPTGVVIVGGAAQTCPKCNGFLYIEPPYQPAFFVYVVNATLTASGQGQQVQLTILSRADFELVFWTGTATSTTLTFNVNDNSDRNWFSAAANWLNVIGTAQLQFPFPAPVRMSATVNYTFTFNENSGSTNTVQICLIGNELFPVSTAPGSSGARPGGAQA